MFDDFNPNIVSFLRTIFIFKKYEKHKEQYIHNSKFDFEEIENYYCDMIDECLLITSFFHFVYINFSNVFVKYSIYNFFQKLYNFPSNLFFIQNLLFSIWDISFFNRF